jgi:hypothetical protein
VRARALLIVALAAALTWSCSSDDGGPEGDGERAPVVILILDEVSTDTLLRPDGKIDAERYPSFAALAKMSTWFPNAHTIYDSSFKAVPAILDAKLPKRGTAPDVRSHRPTAYHLFDQLGYDVVDVESATALCPRTICPGARTRRPGVLARLAGGGRPARLHAWIGAIRRRSRPTFYFQHALLPHEPWIYLPSGRQSRPEGNDPVPGINRRIGFHDPALTRHNEVRHLLQVGYVDHELGLLLSRLRRTGMLDRVLLVVSADHGYSFELGAKDRRLVTERNIHEIAPVPFFVKAPGQREGAVDRSLVRNVDILPTVADLLGERIDWSHDGHSAFSATTRGRGMVRIPTRDFARVVTIGAHGLERRRQEVRLRRARTFGTGARSALLFGSPWASLYRVGSHPELLGRRVGEVHVRASQGPAARVANVGLLRSVSPAERILPTRVAGTLAGGRPGTLRDVAVAVNGRLRATGRSFRLRGRRSEFFSLLVPEDSLRAGRNSLVLFEVGPGGNLTSLFRTASPSAPGSPSAPVP